MRDGKLDVLSGGYCEFGIMVAIDRGHYAGVDRRDRFGTISPRGVGQWITLAQATAWVGDN